MGTVFAGADPSVRGGVALPGEPAALLRWLEALAPRTLVCTSLVSGPAVEDLRRYLRAGVRPDVRVVELALPPTVIPVIAMLADVGAVPPGAVETLAAEVAAVCPTVAVVDDVARLEAPAPSVAQHLAGWLPGVWFGIDVRGKTVRRQWVPTALDGRRAAMTVTASAADRVSGQWEMRLGQATPGEHAVQLSVPVPGPWGSRRWAELTAVPGTVDDLVHWARTRVRIVDCPWCGDLVSPRGCPFCGILPAGRATTGPPPTAPASVPTPVPVPAHPTGSVVR